MVAGLDFRSFPGSGPLYGEWWHVPPFGPASHKRDRAVVISTDPGDIGSFIDSGCPY